MSQIELDYVYFSADEGGYIGYFKDFPRHVTQGETIEELEEMLQDMFESLNLAKYHVAEPASQEEIGMIDERMKDYEKDPSSFKPLK